MSEPVLVTGVAGFIGFHTALNLLQRGRVVVGVDNMNDYYDVSLKEDRLKELSNFEHFTFCKVNIADKPAVEAVWEDKGPFKEVVHLAAQAGVRYSIDHPETYIESNIIGHFNMLELCRHTKDFKHLVYASSSSVYGGNKKLPYAVEDKVDHPVSLYAATKKSDELITHSYSHLFGMPATGLRFFTVYGPWGRPDMALYIFTRNILEGKKLPVFNRGEMKRDFTYIDDIMAGVMGVLDKPPQKTDEAAPHRVLNLGNTKSESLMRYIAVIEKTLGKKAVLDLLPMQAGDVAETWADVRETTELTGYRPSTTIEEGIPKFIDWYKSYYKT